VPLSVALRLVHGDGLTPGAFMMGFGGGFAVGVTELFLLRHWFRSLPFVLHLVVKSLAVLLVIYLSFAVLNVLDVIIDGISWQAYAETLFSRRTAIGMLEGLAAITFLLFFVQLDRLLGPGLLLGYVTGRYHRPRKEPRVFMFLDLKGSTALAEEMEASQYFRFLREYFAEMSEAILETNAKIYQYVGDEVVLSWTEKSGIEEANCLRVFFLIEALIQARSEHFLTEYGVVPEFKAGVHAGEVITAQIGVIKSEIVHNGDVLNTTARIQASCNELGHRLVASEELLQRITPGPEYTVTKLGPVALRGKGEPVSLVAVDLADGRVGADLG